MNNLILQPIVSEKAVALNKQRVYQFVVPRELNKLQIAHAIGQQYGVKVESVNTAVTKGKPKQVNVKRGRQRVKGRRSDYKKASVKLAPKQKIELFEEKK